MAAERMEGHPQPPQDKVTTRPPSEAYRPQEDITQTLDRLGKLINGKEGDPVQFWEEAKARADAFTEYYEVDKGDQNKMTDTKVTELSSWIEQDQKRDKPYLSQAANALISLWNRLTLEGQGHPGHDKRHFQKDLTAALEYRHQLVSTNDPMGSYQKASLLGSFGHDMGRLLEKKTLGTPAGGEMGTGHPKLSFAIMADILDHFKEVKADPNKGIAAKEGIPQELRDHILYGVLQHQSWPNPTDEKTKRSYPFVFFEPMPRSIMGADRLQLVGPEAVTRFFQFDVGVKPLTAENEKEKALNLVAKPDSNKKEDITSNTSVTHHAEFYMRNLLPTFVPETLDSTKQTEASDETKVTREANKWAVKEAHRLRAQTGIYLWLSSTDEVREQIFAPELANDKGELTDEKKKELAAKKKRLLPDDVWQQIKQIKDHGLPEQTERMITIATGNRTEEELLQAEEEVRSQILARLMREVLHARNAAVETKELDQVQKKLAEVIDPHEQVRLARGLAYIINERWNNDKAQRAMIETIRHDKEHYSDKSLESIFANFIADIDPQRSQESSGGERGNQNNQHKQRNGNTAQSRH